MSNELGYYGFSITSNLQMADSRVRADLAGAVVVGIALALLAQKGLAVSDLYLLKIMASVVFVACLVGHGFQRSAGAGTRLECTARPPS